MAARALYVVGHADSFGTVDFGYFSGTADSRATVPHGFIGANGEEVFFASSYADVTATSGDTLLFTPRNPTPPGMLATVVAQIDISGTLNATVSRDPANGLTTYNAYTQWGLQATTLFPGPEFIGLMGGVDLFGGPWGDMPGLRTFTFHFPLGTPAPFTLYYELHSLAAIESAPGVAGTAEGAAVFSSTFRWMGISEVLDPDGNPIDYSLTSESGFDWTQPVPTPVPGPAALLLMGTGLAALAVRCRCYGFGNRRHDSVATAGTAT